MSVNAAHDSRRKPSIELQHDVHQKQHGVSIVESEGDLEEGSMYLGVERVGDAEYPQALAAVRGIAAVYLAAMVVWSMATTDPFLRWFTFLTYWSLSLECVLFLLYIVWRSEPASRLYPLQAIVHPLALIVVVLYYALLPPQTPSPLSIHVHGVSLVLALADLALARHFSSWRHIAYTHLLALVYTVFSLVLFGAGVGPIYSVLDWESPLRALVLVLVMLMVGVPLSFGVMWGWHWGGRRFIRITQSS